MEHKSFFYERVFFINFFSAHNKVDSTADCFCSFKVCTVLELGVIVSVELITANRQLLQELRICNLCNIGIAVVLFITGGVVVHCLLQGSGNSDIIYNKTAFFITEHTIYTSDSLHKIMSGHRLVNIHCCKRWHIKSGQPHINNNCNFKRTVVILKFFCKLVFVVLVSNYFTPFFWVIVAGSHNNCNLFCPSRTKF